MIPMAVNPNITVLVDNNNKVLKIATNISSDVKVTVTQREDWFNTLARGKIFMIENPEGVTTENC